jgi:molybdenum cofactor synthesis domain-containing protein
MCIATAAMIVIGDEILSGRIKDENISHLADLMTAIGIDLREVRIVADDQVDIAAAVNALRARHTYVFTTGGIGPTHDDITADSVAKAFEVPCEYNERAYRILRDHYAASGLEFVKARQRMARMPVGAAHIDNPVSLAPGFRIGNVFVMAGVPAVFQAMLDNVVPTLKSGTKLNFVTIRSRFGESAMGEILREIQQEHPDTIIGCYPNYLGSRFWTVVVRSRSQEALHRATRAIEAMLDNLERESGRAVTEVMRRES